jgi:CBS domain-containing protein
MRRSREELVRTVAAVSSDELEANMNVRDVMTHGVYTTSPDDTVQTAAQTMADLDTGVLPIGENNCLIGILTDRDLSTRVVAEARDPTTTVVRDVMSPEVRYCFEDDSVEQAAFKMSQWHVRRLPVLSREQRVVGIISLGDLARAANPEIAGGALSEIAEGSGGGRGTCEPLAGGRTVRDQSSRDPVDQSSEQSFPASDPPGSHLPDEPPSNAAAKWAAAQAGASVSAGSERVRDPDDEQDYPRKH